VDSENRPLRILHVVESLDPAMGGPPVAALKLATAQARQGDDVHMASYRVPGAERDIAAFFEETPEVARVHQHFLPPASLAERLLAPGVAEAVPSLVGGMDIVHLHGVWAPMLIRVARECRRLGISYVVTPHGMLHPWALSQGWVKKRIGLWVNRQMLDGALFVHALNGEERAAVERLRLEAPIEIFANGIFAEEVRGLPPRGSFRARHPEIGNAPYVLFLSRLHIKKGTDYLAEAFSLLARLRPGVRLVVVGPDGGAGVVMQRRLSEAGLSRRVYFMGPLYGRAKSEAIVDATVFCLPSRQEGLSIAVIEALSAGVPCVLTRACNFPEVEEAGAGYVVDSDASAIALALRKVVDDRAGWPRMSEAGRRLVLERFTWPTIARQAGDAYRRHLARVAAPEAA
jgi:glycosyltransferase involved in cell wall biosynthesis